MYSLIAWDDVVYSVIATLLCRTVIAFEDSKDSEGEKAAEQESLA
jgi:hypothetical protein